MARTIVTAGDILDLLREGSDRGGDWRCREAAEAVQELVAKQPAPNAGEWSVLNTSGVVQDVDGEPVAAARSYQIATQIVADHNAVGLLVSALCNAKRCLERPDRSQLSVRKAVEKAEAALAAAGRRS